jgi:DNA-binding IclR family transcriptional regulator
MQARPAGAILLGMPEDEARAILQTTELEQLTDRTVTDVERLLRLAAEDQTRGWWWRPEASSMGVRAARPCPGVCKGCREALV